MSSFCTTFFTTLSSSLCRRVWNSVENEHTRHANKKCSPHPRLSEPRRSRISSELRRNHAVPRYVPLVAFRAESVDFFLFLFFCLFKRKGVKFGGQMECVVHSSFTSRVAEMNARWTNRSFLSRNIFVEKMCAKKEILSRLSRFAKRVSHARAKRIKSFGWKGKKRVKTSKRGCFLVSLIHFFSHKKNKFLTKFSLMCTPLNTDCKVHGVHGWKPRLR